MYLTIEGAQYKTEIFLIESKNMIFFNRYLRKEMFNTPVSFVFFYFYSNLVAFDGCWM